MYKCRHRLRTNLQEFFNSRRKSRIRLLKHSHISTTIISQLPPTNKPIPQHLTNTRLPSSSADWMYRSQTLSIPSTSAPQIASPNSPLRASFRRSERSERLQGLGSGAQCFGRVRGQSSSIFECERGLGREIIQRGPALVGRWFQD